MEFYSIYTQTSNIYAVNVYEHCSDSLKPMKVFVHKHNCISQTYTDGPWIKNELFARETEAPFWRWMYMSQHGPYTKFNQFMVCRQKSMRMIFECTKKNVITVDLLWLTKYRCSLSASILKNQIRMWTHEGNVMFKFDSFYSTGLRVFFILWIAAL